MAFLADEPGVAEAAVFGAVVLLAGTCEDEVWLVGSFVRWAFFSLEGSARGKWEACVIGLLFWDGAYRSRCEGGLALDSNVCCG